MINTFLGVAACKATRFVLRLMKRGGTTLPGRAAMIFDKNILAEVSKDMNIIVVTGTNGKTTTCRMIEHALASGGRDVLANRSGANLLPGITAEFTANASMTGKPKKKTAVIECDEAALKKAVPLLKPKVIVVTNLFRDQLDRYGEVMHTLEQIRAGVEKVPDSILCLNADCSLTSSLALNVPNRIFYYGIDVPTGDQKEPVVSDAKHCIRCGAEYKYEYHTYAHLGGFVCPKCGYKRHKTDAGVTGILSMKSTGTEVTMHLQEKESVRVKIALPAVYNVYNALSAVCAYQAAGLDTGEAIRSLADVQSGFGRMETFKLGEADVQMILVKNPAGCSQALTYLSDLDQDFNAVFCLNDNAADGHDISWIWDAEYEKVCRDSHMKNVLVWGSRAEDLMLRLKYGGADERIISKVSSTDRIIEKLKESRLPVFILPNYTSMLELRAALSAATGGQEFWKG
ncbi:MAG: MurT ligase domain-containing protein [Eubacterium sp.]|nr:MurT ligase domain-containing protein [Eubacterium sp.]